MGRARKLQPRDSACAVCGFELWLPIATMDEAHLGLYSDTRFPGRCILSLAHHREHYEDLTPAEAASFSVAIKTSVQAIKAATGVDRVNVAILGNEVSHVHAHLIPRRPDREPNPNKAPWEDTRSKGTLEAGEQARLVAEIYLALGDIYPGSTRFPRPHRSKGARVPSSANVPALFSHLSDGV